MHKKSAFLILVVLLFGLTSRAQTTSGVLTGAITDQGGAVVPGVQVTATEQSTNSSRSAVSDGAGYYIMPQLPPGVYRVVVDKSGFASVEMPNVQLQVNQSVTLNFVLRIATTQQTIRVTEAPPTLNTTSATLSTVIDHQETTDLPLNGRQFSQLSLLTPGTAPVETGQQSLFTVSLGAGGVSPSVNGQNGYQNNFTIDGTLNNSLFTDIWAISPPPDAIQEFDVQSHITDARFSISSGANINVVTRSGSNSFHGSLWEFLRNDDLDANTFPATLRLPYRQNQYGLYFGGPVTIPHVYDGKDRTWFSGYWEGFRSTKSQSAFGSTLTSNMEKGNFSGVLGAQVGVDSLGRPEYANEIYDPLTSRSDPNNAGEYLRDPFSGNTIPTNRLSPAAMDILAAYYPPTNLSVPEGTLPNYVFTGVTRTDSDSFGLRIDQKVGTNDTIFLRFSRTNQHVRNPEDFGTYSHVLSNFAQEGEAAYTHIFDPRTILEFHAGYTYANWFWGDDPAGLSFIDEINFANAVPPKNGIALGPDVSLSNGYGGVSQFAALGGPIEGPDLHLDLTKVIGSHTLGAGYLYYHIRSNTNGGEGGTNFTQRATSQDALPGPTGYGPASFLLGDLDSYNPWVGNVGADITVNWNGLYVQDLWQATPKLALTVGLRWDYVAPPNFHKIVSGVNALNGQFIVTGAVPPYEPTATGSSSYFKAQYNGYEPRLGITYQVTKRTVLHTAFAILDDHNNTLVQEDQNIKASWPTGIITTLTGLDLGIPTTHLDSLPAASSFLGSQLAPYASAGANPDNKIPYSMEYNFGVQQDLSHSIAVKLDYVGSVGRHQYINPTANTATVPGPGPISARQPYPQYGGPFTFSWNAAPSSYNAFQANVRKSMSSDLAFLVSYTWSKSLDWNSDPENDVTSNIYNLRSNWGPSNYSIKQMFVLSGVYALPIGRDKMFAANAGPFVNEVLGGWNLGTIVSAHSGLPFNALAGGDIANTGGGNQRAERTGAGPYPSSQSHSNWLNTSAFSVPTVFTYGNEKRDDLTGPAYRDVDFSVFKNWLIKEKVTVQFKSDFFNLLNRTNYGEPQNNVQSSAFGRILSAAGTGREVQFSMKIMF